MKALRDVFGDRLVEAFQMSPPRLSDRIQKLVA
jgi:hypothetical protein